MWHTDGRICIISADLWATCGCNYRQCTYTSDKITARQDLGPVFGDVQRIKSKEFQLSGALLSVWFSNEQIEVLIQRQFEWNNNNVRKCREILAKSALTSINVVVIIKVYYIMIIYYIVLFDVLLYCIVHYICGCVPCASWTLWKRPSSVSQSK